MLVPSFGQDFKAHKSRNLMV